MNHDELSISALFLKGFNVDVMSAKEIVVEAYRESKINEEWEVSGTFIGVRIYEDGALKEDIPLHHYGDYGLFSYTAVYRQKTNIEFATHCADFIANKCVEGIPYYDFKIKKKFTTNKHIYLVNIPADYEVDMPEANEKLQIQLEFEIKEWAIHQKQLMNPAYDVKEELHALSKEYVAYLEHTKQKD